jgi:hypothetical protein
MSDQPAIEIVVQCRVVVILTRTKEAEESIDSLDGIDVESGGCTLCADSLSFVIVSNDHYMRLIAFPKLVDQRLALFSVHLAGSGELSFESVLMKVLLANTWEPISSKQYWVGTGRWAFVNGARTKDHCTRTMHCGRGFNWFKEVTQGMKERLSSVKRLD